MAVLDRICIRVATQSNVGFPELRDSVGTVMGLGLAVVKTDRVCQASVIKYPVTLSPAGLSRFMSAALAVPAKGVAPSVAAVRTCG
jgi:hypothetical protein